MFRQFYKGLSESEIKKHIETEGFSPMKIRNDPDYVYEEHSHPETKLLAFLEGSMEVTVDGEHYSCVKGDKMIIEGNVSHSAVVGNEGCTFFWSEKLT